jgi:hypothetical protein
MAKYNSIGLAIFLFFAMAITASVRSTPAKSTLHPYHIVDPSP